MATTAGAFPFLLRRLLAGMPKCVQLLLLLQPAGEHYLHALFPFSGLGPAQYFSVCLELLRVVVHRLLGPTGHDCIHECFEMLRVSALPLIDPTGDDCTHEWCPPRFAPS